MFCLHAHKGRVTGDTGSKTEKKTVNILLPAEAELAFEVDQSAFIAEQQNDPTLATSGNGYFPQKLKLPACRVL